MGFIIDKRLMSRVTITNPRRTLSEKETLVLTELSYLGKTIFTLDDIKRLIPNTRNVLDKLVRKKWLLKIRRGVYVIVPLNAGKEGADNYTIHSFVIGSVLVEPYYIGYWSALNYYGFTEQIPPRIYVVTKKPKNKREVLDTEFKFVKISDYKWFEINKIKIDNKKINISSPEKTFIDCLDHPEYGGGIKEIAKALYFSYKELDLTKLAEFAIQIKNTAVIKRLGYLSEIFSLEECLEKISNAYISKEYASLEPFSKKKGKIIERWQLRVNAEINPEKWT